MTELNSYTGACQRGSKCPDAVVALQRWSRVTGLIGPRWYITIGHPGFNSPANNRSGYATPMGARAAIRRYGAK